MSGYVFLSNSSKPTKEEQNSRSKVMLTNVSRPCLETALHMGCDVYFGTNRANPENLECELPVHLYDSHTYRSITAFKDNWTAYKNLKNVVQKGNVEVIHCNTPVGGMIGRFVGKRCHVKKVIYTAHGFHFYKGAPLFNRTVLKGAEMLMAHWTDAILTMNQEDYEAAKKFRLRKGGKVYYIPGVGINTKEFFSVQTDCEEKRNELGLSMDDVVCISMGDLIPRKNYETAIKAIAICENPKLHYLICGCGSELDKLKALTKELNVESQIHFLGFRTDIKELSKASDIFLFTTLQEGMPRSMMEAMACGLPCLASKIRGNVDLIQDGVGGFLISPDNYCGFAEKLDLLIANKTLRKKLGQSNIETIKKFDIKCVEQCVQRIYSEVLT